jgi:hypothetical protein
MITLLAACPVHAADDALAEIEIRLEKLEQDLIQARNLSELSKELREDSVSKMFEEFKRQYEHEIKAIRNEQGEFINTAQEAQNTFKNEIKQQTLLIETVWKILLILGLVAVISIFYTIVIQVRKWIKAEVHRQVEDIANIQKDYIRQIVDEKVLENLLKKEKQLLLLSVEDNHRRELMNFFQCMGFNIEPLDFKDIFDVDRKLMKRGFDERKYDLIIFNRLSEREINAYMEKSAQDVFLAYTPTTLENLKNPAKISFANSLLTLYSRTMEALRYQEFMKKMRKN